MAFVQARFCNNTGETEEPRNTVARKPDFVVLAQKLDFHNVKCIGMVVQLIFKAYIERKPFLFVRGELMYFFAQYKVQIKSHGTPNINFANI